MSVAATVVAADERTSGDSDQVQFDVEQWRQLALAVLSSEGAVGELTITFVDRGDIAELNSEHMGKSGATDVLSFPMDDHPADDPPADGVPALLGDVVLSPAVALDQCAEHAGTVEDELALLVVHGVLHVLGHDHAEPGEAAAMRARELDLLIAHHWHESAPAGFRQTHD